MCPNVIYTYIYTYIHISIYLSMHTEYTLIQYIHTFPQRTYVCTVTLLPHHSNKTKKNVTTQKAGVMFDMLNTIAQVRLTHTYIHTYIPLTIDT